MYFSPGTMKNPKPAQKELKAANTAAEASLVI